MARRKDTMWCVEDIALEAMDSRYEDQMVAVVGWLNDLYVENLLLDPNQLSKLKLDRSWLGKLLWKLSEAIARFRESEVGILEDSKQFYQLFKRLIADTDRIRDDDLLKLKRWLEKSQKHQRRVAEQIRGLEEELAEKKQRLSGLYRSSLALLERIMRRDQELIESLHNSKWLPLLRKLCLQISDQEFNQKVEEVYTDAAVTNDQLGNALIKKLKLARKRSEVMNLLETQLDLQEMELRRSKLAEDPGESQESLSERKRVKRRVASMYDRVSYLIRRLAINSAEQEVGYQRMGELVADLRGRISKGELNEADLDPRVVEYLRQVDVELAKYSPCKQDSV